MNPYFLDFRAMKALTRPRGQASILFVLTFLTLFVFFAFVVNLGLIIHYKINLQQTADLAAYTGASWQARALNAIALENFRMRQDYKEYVFHTWVTFGRYPTLWKTTNTSTGRDGAGSFSPVVCLQAYGFKNYDTNTTYCYNLTMSFSDVAQLQVVDGSDAVAATVSQTLQNLGAQAYQQCLQAEDDNKNLYLSLKQRYLESSGLLKRRKTFIEGMEQAFNNAVSPDIMTGNNTIDREVRSTIQANLNRALFDGLFTQNCATCGANAAIPRNRNFLKLKALEYKFALGRAKMDPGGSTLGTCNVSIAAEQVEVPVMFHKDKDTMTYYAVSLRSRPKLLYLPRSWSPVLTAYAAAKPFGGRIGPDPTSQAYLSSAESKLLSSDGGVPLNTAPIAIAGGQPQYPFANIALYPGDDLGWGRASVRTSYTQALAQLGGPDIYPRADTNIGDESRYPMFTTYDGTLGTSAVNNGDARREMVIGARAPNSFDALFFSLFPNSGSSDIGNHINNNIGYQFPGGAWFESDGQSVAGFEAQLGASLAPLPIDFVSPFRSIGWRPTGTEQIRVNDFAIRIGQLTGRQLQPNMLVSSWAPADELRRSDSSNDFSQQGSGLFSQSPGWGRTGYSVKFISFRSISDAELRMPSSGALATTPNITNPIASVGSATDPNIPQAGAQPKLLH